MSADIYQALKEHCLADTALAALVGVKVYPGEAPQNVADPYVVFGQVSSPGHHHLGGPADIATPRFQFDVYGASSPSREAVSVALREALNGFRGLMGSTSPVNVRSVTLQDERDVYEPRADGSESGHFRRIHDFIVTHRR